MSNRFAVIAIPIATLALVGVTGQIVGRVEAGGPQGPSPTAAGRSVWDSVYSSAQADAGKPVYETSCGGCHGPDLNGGRALGLRGDAFLRMSSADTLGRFYTRVKTTMPRNAPDSLSEDQYLAIVAYVLQVNEFPAGPQPLELTQLDKIQVYGKDGPGSVPDFSLVGVVGCLTQGTDKKFSVVNASKPVMTHDPAVSTAADLAKAVEQPLGTGTFVMIDAFPLPEAHKEHKVEVKGFLMKAKGAISVTSLQTVAPTCGE